MSVRVENLTKRFGPHSQAPGLHGVSFEAKSGEITALLGPSGSGKSTALRLIAGLEVPDSGAVFIAGDDCTRLPARQRAIGFVFQNYALFPNMTVRENVAFGLSLRKTAKAKIAERVNELLAMVQLSDYGARYPSQLSGGQRQRIALARALAIQPRVLLLDEPFGALDAQVRQELREALLQLHEKTRITTLLVTHDQSEALELSDRIVVLRDGTVVQVGTPHDLYDHPISPFVASFLGGASVLRGTVRGAAADLGGGVVPVAASFQDGDRVHAFVRPHDVQITKTRVSSGERVMQARVDRVNRIGGQVKVLLQLPTGELVVSQVAHVQAEDLRLTPGDTVFVDLVATNVFHEDYSI